MTVFRAVENRRSLVRSANTGISGFISATGEIQHESSLFKAQSINAKTALLTGHTIFMDGGYRFGVLCLALIPFLLYLSAFKKQKK
ncbi:MAG: hypothetical protein D3925_07590 [Candidatus Electrothrix sp. AR5]|nr:hypothetical protein [Candidatus Electrothrix sp. AR5]